MEGATLAPCVSAHKAKVGVWGPGPLSFPLVPFLIAFTADAHISAVAVKCVCSQLQNLAHMIGVTVFISQIYVGILWCCKESEVTSAM